MCLRVTKIETAVKTCLGLSELFRMFPPPPPRAHHSASCFGVEHKRESFGFVLFMAGRKLQRKPEGEPAHIEQDLNS